MEIKCSTEVSILPEQPACQPVVEVTRLTILPKPLQDFHHGSTLLEAEADQKSGGLT